MSFLNVCFVCVSVCVESFSGLSPTTLSSVMFVDVCYTPPPTTYVLYEHTRTITIHNSSLKMLYFSRLFISSTLGATRVFVLSYM